MIKFVIVLFLNLLLLVAMLGNLITTETQIVSTVILVIVYWCGLFIDD